jgi:hypothetical protein
MEHIGTTGITGITGVGKSSDLTDYCLTVAEMGGNVFTLPGYDVFTDKTHTKTLSQQLKLAELAKLASSEEAAKKFRNSIIAIDQIESKLNHHRWAGILPALYENLADQRRKLHVGIVYTLQIWLELLPSIRNRTWFLYELRDWHYGNPSIPKGENVSLVFTDVLGTKTGIPMSQYLYPWTFHPGSVWPFYDTNQWSDPLEQFRKTKIIGEPNIIDLDNLDGDTERQPSKTSKADDKLYETAKKSLIHGFEIKKKGLKGMAYWEIAKLNPHNRNEQKIAARLNEELGIEKTTNGVYRRDFALVNA